MALTIRHTFVSSKSDGSDTSVVRPSNWNATHTITGTVDEPLLSFSDITTADATTSHHGLLMKLPGDASLFLDGSGNWTTPSGGGGGDSLWSPDMGGIIYYDGTQSQAIPVSIYGSYQGTYGKVTLNLSSGNSETGIQLSNTTDGGGDFTILSTGTGSGAGGGRFVIGSEGSYLTINGESGHIGLHNDNPEYRLDVDGDVNITGSYRQNGVPIQGAIVETNTDLRMLVDLADSNISGLNLRVFQGGGKFQVTNSYSTVAWYTAPDVPVNPNNNNTMPAIGQIIRFFAYYNIYNETLQIGTSGQATGQIAFTSFQTATGTVTDTTNAIDFAVVNSRELRFGFLDQYDHSDTRMTITIHYVFDAFTSPEWWC